MQKTWVLAAESSRARIFAMDSYAVPLREIEALAHPQTRALNQELLSDRPGRSFDSSGQGRHAMSTRVDAKQHEAMTFAKLLGERLERARTVGEFENLVLVAAPEFLGLLRKNLTDNTMKRVTKTIDKNLVQKDEAVIRELLF